MLNFTSEEIDQDANTQNVTESGHFLFLFLMCLGAVNCLMMMTD